LTTIHEHYCDDPANFPTDKFLQLGTGMGASVLIVGEAPARDGWRESGRAFYKVNGEMIPSGKNLNALLRDFDLSIEACGFTELVKCYVGKDRSLLRACGHKCWPIFKRQLQSHEFKLLILLGKETLTIFNREAETKLSVGKLETAKVLGSVHSVFPIYHPSGAHPIYYQGRYRQIKELNQAFFDSARDELDSLLAKIT
jgi:uracil-DNA glycosylase family 4